MRRARPGWFWLAATWLAAASASADPYYLIVAGLGGEPRFEQRFSEQAEKLAEAARRTTGKPDQVIVLQGAEATGDNLRAAFAKLAGTLRSTDSLIVFLIGHGSFDGEEYKLNLPGPDITGKALGELLASVPAGAQLVMNATSASGAVLESWKANGRTVVTATRSGAERTATRFAEHWIAALSSGEADTDKNGLISAQEAFDYASRSVADSYEAEGILATEHPQIAGDNAARLTVARLGTRPAETPELTRLSARMAEIEGELEALRQRRDRMDPDAYLNELQALLLQLATVQQEIDRAQAALDESS
ncbi:MAG: hypothetical protein LOD94_10675, partial [Gammaproteobacteria bacterium]